MSTSCYDAPNANQIVGNPEYCTVGGFCGAADIAEVADPEAYASHMFTNTTAGYQFTNLDDTKKYDVKLGFAESYAPNCSKNARQFLVTLTGKKTQSRPVDVFLVVGCRTGYDLVFRDVETVTGSGFLRVTISAGMTGDAMLAVLEVTEK